MQGRVIEPGDPKWTPKDRQIALALTECEAMTHSCGYPILEAFDEANEAKFEAERKKCFACAALDKENQAIQEEASKLESADSRNEMMAGLLVTLNKKQQMEKPE